MNKIVLQFGLLFFFFSIIYFTQRGMEFDKILFNSFLVFIILTTMLSFIVIGLIKAINKNSFNKLSDYPDNIVGNKKNE